MSRKFLWLRLGKRSKENETAPQWFTAKMLPGDSLQVKDIDEYFAVQGRDIDDMFIDEAVKQEVIEEHEYGV
jgi:hypothetical protein